MPHLDPFMLARIAEEQTEAVRMLRAEAERHGDRALAEACTRHLASCELLALLDSRGRGEPEPQRPASAADGLAQAKRGAVEVLHEAIACGALPACGVTPRERQLAAAVYLEGLDVPDAEAEVHAVLVALAVVDPEEGPLSALAGVVDRLDRLERAVDEAARKEARV